MHEAAKKKKEKKKKKKERKKKNIKRNVLENRECGILYFYESWLTLHLKMKTFYQKFKGSRNVIKARLYDQK